MELNDSDDSSYSRQFSSVKASSNLNYSQDESLSRESNHPKMTHPNSQRTTERSKSSE
jgi:hypothetical protein